MYLDIISNDMFMLRFDVAIYRWHRDGHDIPKGGRKDESLANPYKTEKKDTQDLLVAKANQRIYFPK